MLNRAFGGVIAIACAAALAAPLAASAACLNCYPAASTPLAGSETLVANQGTSTVDIAATDIAKLAATLPNTFTAPQTFPDGSTWGATGIVGLTGFQLAAAKQATWTSGAMGIVSVGAAGNARFDWREGSTVEASVEESGGVQSFAIGGSISAGTAAYCFGVGESGCLWWEGFTTIAGGASPTFQLGSGTTNDQSGMLNLKVLNASAVIELPGNGVAGTVDTLTTSQAILGGQSLVVAGQTAPTLGNGSLGVWIDPTVTSIPGLIATAGHGTVFQAKTNGGCTGSACPNFDMEFRGSDGFGVLYFQNGTGANHVAQIGEVRQVSGVIAANEGMTGIAQLALEDTVAGGGAVTGPTLLINTEPNADWASFGECNTSSSDFCLRLGGAGNLGSPWDDTSATQPDLGMGGCLRLGTASGTAFQGGTGLAFHVRLCDNAGVATFYNTTKSALMPIAAAFQRTAPTTVSALSALDASPADGDRAYVTDAIACTFLSAVTGGGSTHCPVHYDGSTATWKAG